MTVNLLAGPILRRTTKNRVCVWLAVANPLTLQLTIKDSQGNALGQSRLDDLTEQRVQLGKNLWVYLLQARPNEDTGELDGKNPVFLADTLMCYRLDEVDAEGNARPLDLSDLAYGSLKYPSFFIPSKLKHLLHGSCRKPHGGGFDPKKQQPMPDALSHGHALLEKTYDNLELRPSLLLLTGDQIYADDVAISLLAMLRQQSLAVVGKQESLPLVDNPLMLEPSLPTRLDPSSIPLHGRKQVLMEKHRRSHFSSGESENHLFTFGEYAAMYLYAFGNSSKWEPVWNWQDLAAIGVAESETTQEGEDKHSKAKAAWLKQAKPLRSYHETLPQVRQLLANIPTYMIFDDHDVTDDWNITGNWYDGVRGSAMGRRIVSNALAAYWAFQAWGNDPDNFHKDLAFSVSLHLNDDFIDRDGVTRMHEGNSQCLNGDAIDSAIGDRYDLHMWKSRGWGFSIPTEPPIIAMDSRTQRQYENKYYPAVLMDRYALDWLRVEWAKLKTGQDIDDNTGPIIIAATPVMGFSAIEHIQQIALWLAGWLESWKPMRILEKLIDKEGFITGWMVNKLDAESWSSNKEGFVGFMDTLLRRMNIKRCVFLSGDVHYAFTANAQFKYQGRTLQCCQLTSTALSNQPNAKQYKFLEHAAGHDTGIKTHRHWALMPNQRWTSKVQLLQAENSKLRVFAECNLGLVKFGNGLPVSHTLLNGNSNLVYLLPAQRGE